MKTIMNYGGLWIVAALVYVALLWAGPYSISGWNGVMVAHATILLAAWASYGMHKFDQ